MSAMTISRARAAELSEVPALVVLLHEVAVILTLARHGMPDVDLSRKDRVGPAWSTLAVEAVADEGRRRHLIQRRALRGSRVASITSR
jgi:hypothetical protein